MGIAMMVDCDSSLEPLPMQRFMQELVRGSSGSAKQDVRNENSAKSVLDFDMATKSNNNKDKNLEQDGSSHSNTGDTFDIDGLVLVSDNARVFAKSRPRQNKAPLTSASWHSSSELRKMHTAKTRWGGTRDSSPTIRNKTFQVSAASAADNRFGPPSRPRSITRRTSDSCLSVPTRSWMKPQRQQSETSSQSQLPPSQSMQSIRARRLGQPVPPVRSSLPCQNSASLVASRFSASPLEAALEARRSWHSRPAPPQPTSSSESLRSLDSCKSFESCDSDEDLLDRASRVVNRPPRISARDSRQLISVAKTAEVNANTSNSRWSPQFSEQRKSRTRKLSQNNSITNANKNVLSNAATYRKQLTAHTLPNKEPQGGFAPIPPSLLLPHDRFQADAPNADSSGSLSSQDSRRAPRLSRSRSSKSSGSRLSTRFPGSQSSLSSGGSGGSRNSFGRMSRNSLSRNSMTGSRSNNLLVSRSYHNHYSSNSSFHTSSYNNNNNQSLRSQSDHNHSPVSTLELALGDMAPKRRTRGGRKTVGRARSSDY